MTEKSQQETLSFQTEVKQLLHLVTHSLYSNKEIFLRELISNASDALDKLRFLAISDAGLYENDSELKIQIEFDPKEHTITVTDNGIGMSREEAIENLGTIAKSGTQSFLQSLTETQLQDHKLIGQFGVGFYSAFIIAQKVTVKTRRAGMLADQGVIWESTGEGEYTIDIINKPERGTQVILHLKDGEDEFLDSWRLRSIITKYSDHILFPIMMLEEKPITKTEDAKEEAPQEEAPKYETVNSAKALWTLPKKDIKDEDYKEFYKQTSHDFTDPLIWTHNKVEGKLEYTSLLYIPSQPPFNLWDREHPHGLKLFVQHVFIMDDTKQLIPIYLRFVRGIVDSNDLPLNVSRELLQSSKVIESMRSGIINRVLDMLEKLAAEDNEKYLKFWNNFGQVLKEGSIEDYANKDRINKLLRFNSTKAETDQQSVALADYISRMPAEQTKIYYLTADSLNTAKNSPHLEIFRKRGIEVLLLCDRVDEWLVAHLTEYEGKQLQSITKEELDLSKIEDETDSQKVEKHKEDFATILEHIKKILSEKVEDVRLSHRLTDSPTCLVSKEAAMSSHLQRLLKASGQAIPNAKPILELNPDHVLVQKIKAEQDDERFAKWVEVLFGQALLAEGGQLENTATFVKNLNDLLASAG